MSAIEQALDQHLRMADKTYDEWEEYLDIIDPVKYIKLTQGKYAIVDVDLFDWLNQWNWHAFKGRHTFYAKRMGYAGNQRITISMHREILGLSYGDNNIADHINQDGLDNRLSNLRVVSHVENLRNHKLFSNNTSGFSGVAWCERDKKWRSRVFVNQQEIPLGYHTTIEDAIIARRLGELKYW